MHNKNGIIEIDLNRFVTKKYFREALAISSATLNNWIHRDKKVPVLRLELLGLELIDLDKIYIHSLPYQYSRGNYFYRSGDNWRLAIRRNEIAESLKSKQKPG